MKNVQCLRLGRLKSIMIQQKCTSLGKFLGGVFAIAGVGLLALPAGILSSGFFEMLHVKNAESKSAKVCPHCGKEIN